MINFKVSGICAGAAFVLSLLFGLIGGTGLAAMLIRAVLFAAVFFALCCAAYILAGQFLPELFSGADDDLGLSPPGSRVDISVGSGIPQGAFPRDDSDELDNIEGRKAVPFPGQTAGGAPPAPGLDQNKDMGYTGSGGAAAQTAPAGADSAPAREAAEDNSAKSGELDLMPDFNTLSEALLPENGGNAEAGGEQAETAAYETPEPERRVSSGGRSKLEGDFNPEELAKAIRTVLKKDEND